MLNNYHFYPIMQNRTILTNANIVTPNDHFTGTLIIEHGLISDLVKDKKFSEGVDLKGQWLTPGAIDIHSDYIEKELHPRPSANFPLDMAFHFMDQRAAACGITTLFTALSFSDDDDPGRTFETSVLRSKEINELSHNSLIRHYMHARINPNTDEVLRWLPEMKTLENLKLIVFNDANDTDRQVPYDRMLKYIKNYYELSDIDAKKELDRRIERAKQINHRLAIYDFFKDTSVAIGSHDDTTPLHVLEASNSGATLAEMPCSIVAAREAKQKDMAVCMGAPNYVRGKSHCGNLSCMDAMEENLVDMLCSDYHFPTLFAAFTKMIHLHIPPHEAINYISLNPAKFLGMDSEIGSIEIGKKADLVAFELMDSFAKVNSVWVDGVNRFSANFTRF